jgi:hypothetical protein
MVSPLPSAAAAGCLREGSLKRHSKVVDARQTGAKFNEARAPVVNNGAAVWRGLTARAELRWVGDDARVVTISLRMVVMRGRR